MADPAPKETGTSSSGESTKDTEFDKYYLDEDEGDHQDGATTEKWGTSKLKIIGDLLSQVKIGHDLSRVTLPTFLLEPWSLLEKYTTPLTHFDLFLDAVHGKDPVDRIHKFARWYVSSWHKKPKGVKKPYNPLLGEWFRCKWLHNATEDRRESVTHYIAEQVSHHPPVSAFYLFNKIENFQMYGHLYTKSKFLGNSAASLMEGEAVIELLDKEEKYVFTFPDIYARGVVVGSLTMETCGKTYLKCEKHGLTASFDFKEKGIIFAPRIYNQLEATIKQEAGEGGKKEEKMLSTLDGAWDSVINITDFETKKKTEFIDVRKARTNRRTAPMIEDQGEYESRRNWRYLTAALRAGDLDKATASKSEREEKQRAERKIRNEKHDGVWNTAFFHLEDPENGLQEGYKGKAGCIGRWLFNNPRTTPFSEEEQKDALKESELVVFGEAASKEGSVFVLSTRDWEILHSNH